MSRNYSSYLASYHNFSPQFIYFTVFIQKKLAQLS